MRPRIARHHEPSVASSGMVPKLFYRACDVAAFISEFIERLAGVGRGRVRPDDARISEIRKFVVAAFAAIRTVDAHDGLPSMQVGLIAHSLLVDHVARAETIEAVSLRHLVRLVAR